MTNTITGTSFRFEYDVIIGEKEDRIYNLKSIVHNQQAEVAEDEVIIKNNIGYFIFDDNSLTQMLDTTVYMENYVKTYSYYENSVFEEYRYVSWDIDDFGDNEDGWEAYAEAAEHENQRYEDAIDKLVYEGFIVSKDEELVNRILNQLDIEFCKENEITNNK